MSECCQGLCEELITRPEESHRLWYVAVCDLETSWTMRPWPTGGGRGQLRQKQTNKIHFLVAFAKLRNTTISFFVSVCPSVRPHGTARLSLDGFPWNVTFEYCFYNLSREFKFHSDETSTTDTLREDQRTFTAAPRWISIIIIIIVIIIIRIASEESCRENQDTHFQ